MKVLNRPVCFGWTLAGKPTLQPVRIRAKLPEHQTSHIHYCILLDREFWWKGLISIATGFCFFGPSSAWASFTVCLLAFEQLILTTLVSSTLIQPWHPPCSLTHYTIKELLHVPSRHFYSAQESFTMTNLCVEMKHPINYILRDTESGRLLGLEPATFWLKVPNHSSVHPSSNCLCWSGLPKAWSPFQAKQCTRLGPLWTGCQYLTSSESIFHPLT